ncbi:hypothetical protein K470DRAFT_29518 [Piedraia hortae CBS 480.64]|uniref:Secreted protein n=1 Tax=Piedraia hortae CBS 480.64 TaxID=1314780 RepID=A0A6A7C4W4_9PEZI|nr:hypothetical protein K470DRAFT_29518 [Piedraia hortae CBS 480.64]
MLVSATTLGLFFIACSQKHFMEGETCEHCAVCVQQALIRPSSLLERSHEHSNLSARVAKNHFRRPLPQGVAPCGVHVLLHEAKAGQEDISSAKCSTRAVS